MSAPLVPVAESLRPFLPEPGRALDGPEDGPWAALHGRLLAGEPPSAIEAEIARVGAREPAGAAALLRAEARLADGRGADAFVALEALPPAARARPAVRLVEARAREAAGDPVEAYAILHELSPATPAVAAHARGLEERAVEALRGRVAEALRRGRGDEARRDLERLSAWRPHDPDTFRASAAVARARGDAGAELSALRALDAGAALEPDSRLRLAELELEVGSPDAALRGLEQLAKSRPGDQEVELALDRARFRWRLAHAPDEVQAAGRRNPLTRADLARLLYWLVPEVRAGRGGVGRIASDVVGHPAQDEVVRVVNLGLMRVDESLHRFEPDRVVRRGEALEAVFRAASAGGNVPGCARDALAGSWTREALCQGAVGCGMNPSISDCLPGGALSGPEALTWIHLALAQGGGGR